MPLKNSILTVLIFVVTCVHFTSCVNDELQSENSLEGVWNVTEIFSLYDELSTDQIELNDQAFTIYPNPTNGVFKNSR
jgi:hypothetical protein